MYRWVTYDYRSLWQFLTMKNCTGRCGVGLPI